MYGVGVLDVLQDIRKLVNAGEAMVDVAAKRDAAVGVGGQQLHGSTKKMIETHLLEFLKNNRNVLDNYLLPGINNK